MSAPNPYDELPYLSYPIEWTAPERLAVASLLHGGPRPRLDAYRVLELGCGTGANLLALAHYRRHGTFIGVDGAAGPIAVAEGRHAALGLSNLEFFRADFRAADRRLTGEFDFILAHGVFSWVPDDARDALLELVARRLRPGGLFYVNYNTRPGWDVRGLVREFLLAQTADVAGLRARAAEAQAVAARVAAAMDGADHPYSRLLANEFRFVADGNPAWVGHEFLAEHNAPYWRSDFLRLVGRHGLAVVADADFNYPSGRVPPELVPRLNLEHLTGRSVEDTVDLLCYRQLHSPILTPGPFRPELPEPAEFGTLYVASCLDPLPPGPDGGPAVFRHPTGYEVEAKESYIADALDRLRPLWPAGRRVAEVFSDVPRSIDDLRLLHQNGLIELRCVEPDSFGVDGSPLHQLEREWGGYLTRPDHRTERIAEAE
jgi:SAM-dependent methyltransferase